MYERPATPRRAIWDESTPRTHPSNLTWCPKPFTEGDLDGQGQGRLLGTSEHVDAIETLVREAAQNSWDARLGGPSGMDFRLDVRRATRDERQCLAGSVFTGTDQDLDRALPALRPTVTGDLWLLEVSDRGTKGLGGSTSSRRPPDPEEPTDYRDFVLNLGAPRDQQLGGGTYGFGKTATYRASTCGCVVIWSQARVHGRMESRLIASAMGGSFNMAERRYTGRHWWALPNEDGSFEPMTGTQAIRLGNQIFRTGFGPEETGTSLLVIQPDMAGQTPDDYARTLAAAVTKHLWPKLVPGNRDQMRITVTLDGVAVPVPGPFDDPVLASFSHALQAVRAMETGGEPEEFLGRYSEVRGNPRPGKRNSLLGYLAMAPFPEAAEASQRIVERPRTHDVCLMRSEAELVVRYLAGPALPRDGRSWAAVFKPHRDHDDAFAESEPPTHDDWAPKSVTDPGKKSVVTVALRRIRELLAEWTAPAGGAITHNGGSTRAGHVADALSDLVPDAIGSRPGRYRQAGSRTGTHSSGPSAGIVHNRFGEDHNGLRRWAFQVKIERGAGRHLLVVPRVRIASVEGALDHEEARILGWTPGEGPPDPDLMPQQPGTAWRTMGDTTAWVFAQAPADLAVSISLDVDPDEEG